MSLRERLAADLKAAMKARDSLGVETIRSVRGAVKNREIDEGAELGEEEIVRVIRSLAKQRTDSIEQFASAGREDLVAKETAEREILIGYLPAAPDAADVERVVAEVIAEVGASGPGDIGKVMRPALERLGAGADGKLVNQVVRKLLS